MGKDPWQPLNIGCAGAIAQLEERLPCTEEAAGSSPAGSTRYPCAKARIEQLRRVLGGIAGVQQHHPQAAAVAARHPTKQRPAASV